MNDVLEQRLQQISEENGYGAEIQHAMRLAAEAAMEWLPIDSAPKDGVTLVDLWFPTAGRRTNWRWYRKNKFWGSVAGRFDSIDTCDELPTHWIPLPKPPKVKP